jgi:hypothetical protein
MLLALVGASFPAVGSGSARRLRGGSCWALRYYDPEVRTPAGAALGFFAPIFFATAACA